MKTKDKITTKVDKSLIKELVASFKKDGETLPEVGSTVQRSTHSFDRLCQCGHSKLAHRGLAGKCFEPKCCLQYIKV